MRLKQPHHPMNFTCSNHPQGSRIIGWLLASLLVLTSSAADSVRLIRSNDVVSFLLRDRPVVVYQGGEGTLPSGVPDEYRRAGYLHPVTTPSGQVVTGDYPSNHLHHHGFWTAWTRTEFAGRSPDFWNMGQKKGRVEFVRWLGSEETPDAAELRALHRYVDLSAPRPLTVLEEAWTVRVLPTPLGEPYRIDLTLRQTNVTTEPLTLPKYHYGGLGFRGLDAWNGPTQCLFLTSEGITNRLQGNETRGRWCWIGGAVSNGVAGVAILGHPTNFRSPEPMRLNPTEPFFCFAPQQLGEFSIPPGGTHVARYRILVADGPPDAAALERQWTEWARVP